MAELVAVHGIGQQQLGRHQLLARLRPALADGLERALGRPVPEPPVDLAFYGDLYLSRRAGRKDRGEAGRKDGIEPVWEDLDPQELDDLLVGAREAVTEAELAEAERTPSKAYTRAPRSLQVVLAAIDRRFGFSAGVLHVGVLRQVRRYLRDPELKAAVDERVRATVDGGARVLVGHSLGSLVAYECLRRRPDHGVVLLLTVGSPLGLRMVRDRIAVEPIDVPAWVNIRARGDPVTCAGDLTQWWPQVREAPLVHNGGDAHAAERYLSKQATGEALIAVLPELIS